LARHDLNLIHLLPQDREAGNLDKPDHRRVSVAKAAVTVTRSLGCPLL
jgi:hypothetical protein